MKLPTVEEQIKFFEKILDDENLYLIVLASLISEDELRYNKKNQEKALNITKFILNNIEQMKLSEDKIIFIKNYLEKVPQIIQQFNIK